jgi:hypothetical protein
VGIRCFPSKDTAECILIERFEDTFLGIEDDGSGWVAPDYFKGTYLQVHKSINNLNLRELVGESDDVTVMPKLIYEAQTPGNWSTFGYFYDKVEIMQRRGKKRPGMRMLEVFAGAGGSLLGYKNEGFDSVMAIENDGDAVKTLKLNNPGLKVCEGCVRKFVDDYETLKCALGRIDHVSSMFRILPTCYDATLGLICLFADKPTPLDSFQFAVSRFFNGQQTQSNGPADSSRFISPFGRSC